MDYTQSVHISISDLEHAQITLSKDFDTPFGHILCSFSLYRHSLEMISCTEQQGMYNALDSFTWNLIKVAQAFLIVYKCSTGEH